MERHIDGTPVWLKARYIQRGGRATTVELLGQAEVDVISVSGDDLRRMPPWPQVDWTSTRMVYARLQAVLTRHHTAVVLPLLESRKWIRRHPEPLRSHLLDGGTTRH